MKKSRIAKLALMGASITALAATLTTSTYAWYVSSKTANTSAATGSTASADSDGSVLLSVDGKYGTFYKSIALNSLGDSLLPSLTTDGVTFNALTSTEYTLTADTDIDPLMTYYTRTGEASPYVYTKVENPLKANISTYYTKKPTVTSDGSGTAYHISFYLLATNGGTVTPNIKVSNTTTSFTPQQNITNYNVPKSGGNTLGNGELFTSNVLNALALSFTSTPGTKLYGDTGYNADTINGYVAGSTSSVSGNHLTGSNKAATSTTVSPMISTYNTTALGDNTPASGAHNYYEAVSGYELTAAQKTRYAYETGIGTLSAAPKTVYKMDYYLYLDGASDLCFNSCALQNLSIEFSYSLS